MIFAFPGQGSQVVGMGKDIYDNFAVAKEVFNEVDDVLGKKLSNIIFHGDHEELTTTENAQPALLAVSIAIVRTMEYISGRSIFSTCKPKYICGHSVGEYTALCAAGALTLNSAAKLLQIRGKAMQKASLKHRGYMVALLGAELQQVEDLLKLVQPYGICEIANDNGGGQIVVSGTTLAIDKLIESLSNSNIKRSIKLKVSGPFHSSLMQSAYDEVIECLDQIKIKCPVVPIISNVTAKAETEPEVIKDL